MFPDSAAPNSQRDGDVASSVAEEWKEYVKTGDLAGLTTRLIAENHHGVLTTVDAAGKPHVRWIGTLSFHDFPRFYALTAPTSRKIKHIQDQPCVEWMFSKADLSLIVNLIGNAAIVADTHIIKKVWRLIEDKSEAYFLNMPVKGAGFTLIETTVSRIECTLPQQYLRLETEIIHTPETEHERWRTTQMVGVSLAQQP